MQRREFEALVSRLDDLATRDREGYRRRVVALAVLGYGYLAVLVVALSLLTLAALASVLAFKALGLKLALVIGGFLWVVVRSLWVRIDPPAGAPVTRAEAPVLFAPLDWLRGGVKYRLACTGLL